MDTTAGAHGVIEHDPSLFMGGCLPQHCSGHVEWAVTREGL